MASAQIPGAASQGAATDGRVHLEPVSASGWYAKDGTSDSVALAWTTASIGLRGATASQELGGARPVRIIGLRDDHASDEIPSSHRDLIECPPVAALTTVMPDGYPQTSVVWCDYDGEFMRVNTMRGFAKERNMRREPRVTLLCYDPRQPLRYLEVRGTVVEMTEDGAGEHLDALASKYAGRPIRYFGDAIPARFAETETPILCRIRPFRVVTLDATGPGGGI